MVTSKELVTIQDHEETTVSVVVPKNIERGRRLRKKAVFTAFFVWSVKGVLSLGEGFSEIKRGYSRTA